MTTPSPELHNPLAGGGDHCPSCGASLASDQRYCLACGHRRGDPRLPFMDAVTFMESSKRQPQTPQEATAPTASADRRPFMSANASLVAGVATLVLAIGVGVLIGRSGDSGSSNVANTAPQVIKVEGGGGGTESAVASTGGASGAKSKGGSGKSNAKAKKKLETQRQFLRRMKLPRPKLRSGGTSSSAMSNNGSAPNGNNSLNSAYGEEFIVDLQRRREQLVARVAELQWDLGGLVYEMIVRNSINVDVIVKRAVPLQDADAELAEVERILRTEETGTAGSCSSCGAPHSSGATFCWQCGKPLLAQVSGDEILKR